MSCLPNCIAGALAFSLGAVLPSEAAAQTPLPAPDLNRLPEVVITAERVEATLRKTPVSVVAISNDEIERKGIAQLSDLVGVVAGVVVPNGFSNMPQAVGIRGVGVSNPAMSQAVAVYVDDIPLVRGFATALWDLPDISRIEVLRGPQGTLYGQNSTAGAVKIISRDPGGATGGWVSAGLGTQGSMEAHGFGNVQLGSDGTAATLAFSRRRNDGFGWNETLKDDVNNLDATQFRAKLRHAITTSTTAVLAVDGLLDKSDANTTGFPLNHPDTRPRVMYTSDPYFGQFKRRAGGLQFKVESRLDSGATLRLITGYRGFLDDPTRPDFGGLEVARQTFDQTVRQKALSQELQLQGRSQIGGTLLGWTTGLMLMHDRFDFERYIASTPVATNVTIRSEAQTHLTTSDAGLYAQGRLSLGGVAEGLGLTAGLRAYRTRQTGANAFYRTDAQRVRTSTVYQADDLAFAKSGLLPRLGLDWQASDAHFLYASVAEGAKFGGYNRAAESLQSALVATRPEKVRTYEAGLKSRLADGRLTTHVAAFYNDYRDYLAVLNNTVINGTLVTDPVMVNAGRARTYGVDIEAAARLTRELEWNASVEWLKSCFTEFANPTGAAGTDFVNHELPYAPRLSAGTGLAFNRNLADGASLRLDVSAQYLRHQFADAANTALLVIPTQVYLNLGAAYTTADGRWTFSLRVRNLQDKTYVLLRTRIPPLGVDAGYYSPPRTALLSARYEF